MARLHGFFLLMSLRTGRHLNQVPQDKLRDTWTVDLFINSKQKAFTSS